MSAPTDLRPTTRVGRTQYVRNPRPVNHGTPGGYRRCTDDHGHPCAVCKRWNADARATYRATNGADALGPPGVPGPCRCSCGVACESRTALGKHTWAAHDRPPTDAERVILTGKQVAA